MIDVLERDGTLPSQEDYQPAAGEDDEMESPENDRMHSNYGAPGEEETTEETRTKIIEADHDSRDQAGETNSITEQPQDAQEAETEDDANTENHENEEENDEEGNDESNDESDSENSEEVVDDDDTTLEREETQESQQDDNEEQATASATNDHRQTFPMGNPGAFASKQPATGSSAKGGVAKETTNDNPIHHHMNNKKHTNSRPVTIKIFQANVDKGKETHGAALQLAFLEGYNVVIMQEPSTSYSKKKQLCRTQHHPGFSCFSPVDSWHNNDTRPRVMTYVKKDNKIRAEPKTISTEEIEKAVLHTGNTTPGSNGITTKMLQTAWSHIARPLTTLYNACLQLGHHPSIFKAAKVVMIPKMNKRDLSDVGSWRPISLLSCLSKGLERVIARRMAYAALRNGILHPSQAGALPKRSAVDIVASLIYDIEKALAAGKVATLVTEDVMGAFDAILRNRMVLCLRQQGWPDFLIRCIASFLLDRQASVRFQDTTTPSTKLGFGLPQGSPISPILYILITAAIYFLPGAAQRYGYADDTAMLFIGDSLEDTTSQANEAIAAMESWGRGEAIYFDPKKTEIMHFSRRKADHSQSPVICHGDKEIRAAAAMRWLGIYLDKKLTFNHHINEWTQKARRVINHLRVMNNTVREGPAERQTKENAVAEFEKWLASRPPGYVVFSDGSKTETDTAGHGFAVFHHGQLLDWGSAQLGRREVFDAVIHGALAGLKAAIQRNSHGSTAADSSQACFREFQKIGDRHPYLISVKWSPGHTGIFELSLPRRMLGYLLTARSQHGDFAEYHERFHPGQATLECPCGRQKSPTHLFYCRKIPGHLRVRLAPDPETAVGKFLGRSYKVFVGIADFYYSKINKLVGATRLRWPPRTQNANIIVIPLTGIDFDRHMPPGAKLLRLEDDDRKSIPGATSENLGATRLAFLYANDDSRYESLQKAVLGLVFLGTPFRGPKWQPLADALARLMGPKGSPAALRGSWGLTSRHYETAYWFYTLRNKLSTAIACFSELHETNYGRWLRITGVAKVADETSACIPGLDRYALDKDHLKSNKYYGPTDPAFERVSDAISEMCRRASDIVRRRFERREIITDNHVALQYNPKAEACLHDLFVIDPLEDKTALKRKKGDRAAGTCEWMLGTEELTAWLGSRQNPGSESQANQVLPLIDRDTSLLTYWTNARLILKRPLH
ncbi:reverse transcriptase, RNaseH [Cordyceps javanica]|nr:reverse transcriptase, RNaseH [Cordyceps javanica]